MTVVTTFRFTSARTANRLVAGVPAAARLARAFAGARPGEPLVLVIGGGGALGALAETEIARLAPQLVVRTANDGDCGIPAETLPDAPMIDALLSGSAPALPPPAVPQAALDAAARTIIKATAKPGDGIVSRHLNRPLSQAASRLLLRFHWVRPGHATALTALIALAMLACLLTATPAGLVAGAVLFQLASVADGIDGEIARATFRTSASGAAWDSGIDAATNLGFLGGVIVNLWLRGDAGTAQIGLAGMLTLALGTVLLGLHARRRGDPLHFNAVKTMVMAHETPIKRWLRYLTMRDFYCLFFAVMVVLDFAAAALTLFAIAAAGWLVTVIALLWRARQSA
jgi:CDP-L-myo-inositol myo-inositolphosphotransferase